MANTYDWLFWIGGAVLGIAGLILLVWSLFADRSKGRKRCPKCWYEMTHSPGLTCSECGRTAKRERKLLKTRRRWRWVIAGFIVVIGGVGIALSPGIRSGSIVRSLPTSVLLQTAAELDAIGQPVMDELQQRFLKEPFTDEQLEKFAYKYYTSPFVKHGVNIRTREQWPVGASPYYLASLESAPNNSSFWNFTPLSSTSFEVKPLTHDGEPDRIWDNLGFGVTFCGIVGPSGWSDSTKKIGQVQNGINNVFFEVIAEVDLFCIGQHGQIDSREFKIKLPTHYLEFEVKGDINSVIEPVKTAELQQYFVDHARMSTNWSLLMFDEPSNNISVLHDVAIAVDIELLRNDKIIGNKSIWWQWGSKEKEWHQMRFNIDYWHTFRKEKNDWFIHVKSNPELALHCLDADKYWEGEFTIPVTWDN